jgi:hypothetical protein
MGAASFEGPAVVIGGAILQMFHLHHSEGELHALALTRKVPE